MLYKIGILKYLAKFTEETPVLESLFNKVAGLRPSTLLKRHSRTGVFLKKYKYRSINKYVSGLCILKTSTG